MVRYLAFFASPLLFHCSTTCNMVIECGRPLAVHAQIPLNESAVDGLALSFCRNGACATGIVFQGAATLFGTQGTTTFHVDVLTKAIASGTSDVSFSPAFDGFVNGSGDVADGDTYEVKITSGATVIVDDTRKVDFVHGSAGCRDGACYQASYTITAA